MPPAQMYRVVEANFVGGKRVEKDIGCAWKSEKACRDEMRALNLKHPKTLYSMQKQPK